MIGVSLNKNSLLHLYLQISESNKTLWLERLKGIKVLIHFHNKLLSKICSRMA